MWKTYWYSKNRGGTSHNKRVSGLGTLCLRPNPSLSFRTSDTRQTLGDISLGGLKYNGGMENDSSQL